MNKSEIKVDYVVRHVSTNLQQHADAGGRKGKRRPQSASAAAAAGAGRRNSLLAATIQEEFVTKKSSAHQNGGGFSQGGFTDTHAGGRAAHGTNRSAPPARTAHADTLPPAEQVNADSTQLRLLSTSMRSRPATAPKRRPPVMVHQEEELPLWHSRGTIDMADTLLQQDNRVSVARRKEWPAAPRPPTATENVLGLNNSDSRKTIKSSNSRLRIPKTSGPVVNLKPYKMPPHYFPAAIVRSETPAESPALRDREPWSFETILFDPYERAKPAGKPDKSPAHFRETYRLPPRVDRDHVDVARSLDTITAAYPRGKV